MNNSQEEITLLRDVSATLIPHGEEFVLTKGDKVTITHLLGGNYTVMTLNGMYRIAAMLMLSVRKIPIYKQT